MTVRELMNILAAMDPDHDVRIALVSPYVGEPDITAVEEYTGTVLLVSDNRA
jgi:hypothetical protein